MYTAILWISYTAVGKEIFLTFNTELRINLHVAFVVPENNYVWLASQL